MSDKHPDILRAMDTLARACGGPGLSDPTRCATCGSRDTGPDKFRDDLSRREFGISQMCQLCQDNVFEGEDLTDEGEG